MPNHLESDKRLPKNDQKCEFWVKNGATPILANPSHLALSWVILMVLTVLSTLFTNRNFTVTAFMMKRLDFMGTLIPHALAQGKRT